MRRLSMTGTGRCLDAESRTSVALVRRVGERATAHIDEEGEAEERWRTTTGEKRADDEADIAVPWSKDVCSHGGKNHDPLEKTGWYLEEVGTAQNREKWRWRHNTGVEMLRAAEIHVLAGLRRGRETRARSEMRS